MSGLLAIGSPALAQEPANATPPPTTGENTRNTYTEFLRLPSRGLGNPAKAKIATTEAERKKAQEAFKTFAADLQKKMAALLPGVAGTQRAQAVAEAKKAPDRESLMTRLLKNQEERTPQPDVMTFLANTPLLAEVAVGDDRDFTQIIFWNEVALNVTANDHTPLPVGSTVTTSPFEQAGPAKTSRALAIVHIAMFEAMDAAEHRFRSFKTKDDQTIRQKIFALTGFPENKPASEISERTAVAYAAYRALLGVYPKKEGYLTPILVDNLTQIENPDHTSQIAAGEAIGEAAAKAILDDRTLDGSEYSVEEPPVGIFSSPDPMKWKQDPLNANPNVALGALWSYVRPFVGTSAELFSHRPPVPPPVDPNSAAFKEALSKGGDPNASSANPPGNTNRQATPSSRTPDESFYAKFWAYDATALLCAPPRLYNMIATSLALKEKRASFKDGVELARYLALINVALANAGVGAWDAKYYYHYPRPVTGIRDTAPAGSPLKLWTPLGAPVSNAQATRVNFTPPFPSYPSGHAVFGGALFQVLREYFGNDGPAFDFVSDEYNGHNSDPGADEPRPLQPRHFKSFTAAEAENGQSRVLLGIHWQYDSLEGIKQGQKIGKDVFAQAFQPTK